MACSLSLQREGFSYLHARPPHAIEHCICPGMTCLKVSPTLVYFAVGTLTFTGEIDDEKLGCRIKQLQLEHDTLHLQPVMSACASNMLNATITLCEDEVRTSTAELRLLLRIFSKISEAECRRVLRKPMKILSTWEEQARLFMSLVKHTDDDTTFSTA